ncbi:MAG: hypothetical protein ACFHHU_09720 [Porticoccaceae bacterium]
MLASDNEPVAFARHLHAILSDVSARLDVEHGIFFGLPFDIHISLGVAGAFTGFDGDLYHENRY